MIAWCVRQGRQAGRELSASAPRCAALPARPRTPTANRECCPRSIDPCERLGISFRARAQNPMHPAGTLDGSPAAASSVGPRGEATGGGRSSSSRDTTRDAPAQGREGGRGG
eukprot:4110470-Prymnesium_polylepis.1